VRHRPAFRGAAGPRGAGWEGSKWLWRVRGRRSCGGRKVHGSVGGFRARGPFVQLQPVWRLRRLPLALLIYSSLVRGTSKRRPSGWVRPNISSNDWSLEASARRAKVADGGLADSTRARCAPAYTDRDTPSPVQGGAGELGAVAQRATRAEAARGRAHNQRLARHARRRCRALGDAHSAFAGRQ